MLKKNMANVTLINLNELSKTNIFNKTLQKISGK